METDDEMHTLCASIIFFRCGFVYFAWLPWSK